jgi:DNA-binding NtrC family response regulator
MVAVNSGPLLHAADLPSNLQNHLLQKKTQYLTATASASWQAPVEAKPQQMLDSPAMAALTPMPIMTAMPIIPLMELERRAIMNALDYTKGDRAVAAHLLGIGRTTLYRKLKEYQLAG